MYVLPVSGDPQQTVILLLGSPPQKAYISTQALTNTLQYQCDPFSCHHDENQAVSGRSLVEKQTKYQFQNTGNMKEKL